MGILISMVKAKKHLGQHFLKNPETAKRIADGLTVRNSDHPLVEIGPGMGVLTRFLIEGDNPLTLFEIDPESVAYLKANLNLQNVHLVEGDFLKMRLDEYFPKGDFSIIGNFPYNISSQIFFRVLDYREQVREVVGMLQKEVAERLAAPPGGKVYGILSVLLQSYYSVEYLFTVEPEEFVPPPKVRSGVVRIHRLDTPRISCDPVEFKKVVKLAFSTRRKTLRNALKPMLREDGLREMVIFDRRAETLSVEEFSDLTEMIAAQGN